MGSNMQRQAVPLLVTDTPIVGTGMEYKAAKDSGVVVLAKNTGTVEYVDATVIKVRRDNTNGLDFKGVLFVGLMITEDGPRVIEFNNRFGDPETQVILPRIETDLLDILIAVTENKLKDIDIKWSSKKAVCVVLASEGYPGRIKKGCAIEELEAVDEDVVVFHGGTEIRDGKILTSGGRVLGVTAMAYTHEEARKKAYENVARISFEGMQYREDIGQINQNV